MKRLSVHISVRILPARMPSLFLNLFLCLFCLLSTSAFAQIGHRFPSERKVVKDPVTGVMLTFLTSQPHGDSKIYPTHPQWTSDGQWVIFRSGIAKGEAMAVNEQTGDIVQVSEGGYTGMLNVSTRAMKLYFMRSTDKSPREGKSVRPRQATPLELVEVDLAAVFADSKTGKMKTPESYQRVCGMVPAEVGQAADLALDAADEWIYFRETSQEAAKYLPKNARIEKSFGPRNMGAGPGGIAKMHVKTGEIHHVISVPFQIGHIQANLWNPGEIIFCWETGGKSPQRTWVVMADGSGLRPLYPEADYEWVTHEAVISKDEVAMAIMGHRSIVGTNNSANKGTAVEGANPGQDTGWGNAGTREKPSGLAIVNLRTREMRIAGQTPSGSGLWHVHGSSDGRWAVGDDFSRSIYLIDRLNGKMSMLSTGHKDTAADHPHPTFSPDGKKIEIQSAMLSADNRTLNICIIPVPN
ncbi:hypothetical protein [Undibacterium sp. TC9W]|uniref:hypothetical protein n=1 Tax=Undibacterium sp. TC9W TaxID=3413053 RepID=UPI003BF1C88E